MACVTNSDLFHSPQDDGRTEAGRIEREALAGAHCMACPVMIQCLETALVDQEEYGVWGSLGEGDRRKFRQHLIDEGYKKNEIPSGPELKSALVSFYYYSDTPAEKLHGAQEYA